MNMYEAMIFWPWEIDLEMHALWCCWLCHAKEIKKLEKCYSAHARTEAVKTEKNCCASFAWLSCLHLTSYRYCHQLDTPSHTLCSADDTFSRQISRTRLFTVGSHVFSVFSPEEWNHLPLPLWQKNPLWTLSNQTSFYKTIDLPCFQFCAAIFLHLKSLFVV